VAYTQLSRICTGSHPYELPPPVLEMVSSLARELNMSVAEQHFVTFGVDFASGPTTLDFWSIGTKPIIPGLPPIPDSARLYLFGNVDIWAESATATLEFGIPVPTAPSTQYSYLFRRFDGVRNLDFYYFTRLIGNNTYPGKLSFVGHALILV
jgi:hypothetical protein